MSVFGGECAMHRRKLLAGICAMGVAGWSRAAFAASDPALKSADFIGYARIIDGDTLAIEGKNIRLWGIDAPEMKHPYGPEAKQALVALTRDVVIAVHVTGSDRYGRWVAICTLPDGRDLAAELVKMGLALDWPRYSGGAYGRYETAQLRDKLFMTHARQTKGS